MMDKHSNSAGIRLRVYIYKYICAAVTITVMVYYSVDRLIPPLSCASTLYFTQSLTEHHPAANYFLKNT